jgi:hypothetical protein
MNFLHYFLSNKKGLIYDGKSVEKIGSFPLKAVHRKHIRCYLES